MGKYFFKKGLLTGVTQKKAVLGVSHQNVRNYEKITGNRNYILGKL